MIFRKEPTVIDGVKIFIDDIAQYLAESFFLLHTHNRITEYKIRELVRYEGPRKEFIDRVSTAYLWNYNNIREITELLKPYLSIDAIFSIQQNKGDNLQITLKDFFYLRRDWCFYPEGEEQISTIVSSIKEQLRQPLANTLFLGCGVGRIAVEFADVCDKVYATDKSFSMIWHTQKLLNENIEFYEPHIKNILRIENAAQKHTAYIPQDVKEKLISNVDFFVSDVLNMPIIGDALDAVFSIYFSDVIALKLWFDHIDGILKKEGFFIHFGPLDYFFSDETEMLTAEEFRAYFELNGYITVCDKVIETSHLRNPNALSFRGYQNWLFIAQKAK